MTPPDADECLNNREDQNIVNVALFTWTAFLFFTQLTQSTFPAAAKWAGLSDPRFWPAVCVGFAILMVVIVILMYVSPAIIAWWLFAFIALIPLVPVVISLLSPNVSFSVQAFLQQVTTLSPIASNIWQTSTFLVPITVLFATGVLGYAANDGDGAVMAVIWVAFAGSLGVLYIIGTFQTQSITVVEQSGISPQQSYAQQHQLVPSTPSAPGGVPYVPLVNQAISATGGGIGGGGASSASGNAITTRSRQIILPAGAAAGGHAAAAMNGMHMTGVGGSVSAMSGHGHHPGMMMGHHHASFHPTTMTPTTTPHSPSPYFISPGAAQHPQYPASVAGDAADLHAYSYSQAPGSYGPGPITTEAPALSTPLSSRSSRLYHENEAMHRRLVNDASHHHRHRPHRTEQSRSRPPSEYEDDRSHDSTDRKARLAPFEPIVEDHDDERHERDEYSQDRRDDDDDRERDRDSSHHYGSLRRRAEDPRHTRRHDEDRMRIEQL